jgi:N-ethylmaleimide reductase
MSSAPLTTGAAPGAPPPVEQDAAADVAILFTPVRVGPYALPNRLVMAPMTRSRAAAGGVPDALAATYYAQRAAAGLIVTEGTVVGPRAVGYPNTPGIYTAAQVGGWRRVTDAVHAAGGRIFCQLWHVGRVSHPSLQPDGALPVAPSALAPEGRLYTSAGPQPFVAPRALSTEEVAGVVDEFGCAAARALEAGFDGVEVHGAYGYLPDQFLQDGVNRRTDRYGGPVEHRARFLLEVVDALGTVWGPSRVGVKLSPSNRLHGAADADPVATFTHVLGALAARGVAYAHVMEPSESDRHQPVAIPDVAAFARARFEGAVIANGGFGRETAAAAVARGAADLVSFGALYLANPDLAARFARGAPLNAPDRATFYGGGARGYTDYPTMAAAPVAGAAPAQAAARGTA